MRPRYERLGARCGRTLPDPSHHDYRVTSKEKVPKGVGGRVCGWTSGTVSSAALCKRCAAQLVYMVEDFIEGYEEDKR